MSEKEKVEKTKGKESRNNRNSSKLNNGKMTKSKDGKRDKGASGKPKKEKKPEWQFQVDKLLKTTQKDYEQQYLDFLEYINQDAFTNLNSVIDYMGVLYVKEEKNNKNKKKINEILTNPKFISYITNLKNRSTEIFFVLKKIDELFDLQKNADITLNLNTIFYGAMISEEGETRILPPLNSKSIYRLIEIILANDKDLAEKWILEVFNFDKTKLYNKKFEDIVSADDEEFKKILINNSVAHSLFVDMIFSKRPFQNMIELRNQYKESEYRLNGKISDLEIEKTRLESEISSKKIEISNLKNEVSNNTQEISSLNSSLSKINDEFNKLKIEYESAKKSHELQMSIALRQQDELNQLKISSAQKEKEDEVFINKLEDEKERLNKELEALKADYALKSHKLSEMASEKESSGSEARATTMKNLVQKISTPFYYLSMFCQEFNETQRLSEESAPFFIDTINQLESAFALMGAKKYGKLDEIVRFDSMIHEPQGGNLANGDSAKITEPGWKIEDEIFIKAKVEKSEEN